MKIHGKMINQNGKKSNLFNNRRRTTKPTLNALILLYYLHYLSGFGFVITFAFWKSIFVRTVRWWRGCNGRALFPSGALGVCSEPCINRLNAYNCEHFSILNSYYGCYLYLYTIRHNVVGVISVWYRPVEWSL